MPKKPTQGEVVKAVDTLKNAGATVTSTVNYITIKLKVK